MKTPRRALTAELLQQTGAQAATYTTLVQDVVGLLHGTYRSPEGLDPGPIDCSESVWFPRIGILGQPLDGLGEVA
jgi:hypothetical protein